jgi:hypothetical protein
MIVDPETKWLLLIHQIPPKPNYLRVKIWRRLQQIGAVAIKQSVYALPLSEPSREDFSWILKEILAGGGDGSIAEARFVEGLTDDQVVASFRNARKTDYEKIIQEANQWIRELSAGQNDVQVRTTKGSTPLSRLQRRLQEVAAIDFFAAPERATAEILLKDLAARLSPAAPTLAPRNDALANLRGKVWVTRKNLFVDRIACGWLIRRFVDSEAAFRFVDGHPYDPQPNELRFDMFEGEFTHEGDRCTFEVMIQRLDLQDKALAPMAEIVHDIDLKDRRYERAETDGFQALLTGLVAAHSDDDQRMLQGVQMFEHFYAFFLRRKGE